MKKFLTAALVLGAGTLQGLPAKAQTLGEEITTLLENHPRLEWADRNVEAHVEAQRKAKSEYFPQLRAEAEAGYETTNNPSLRTTDDAPFEGNPTMAEISLTQLLVDGGQRSGRNARAQVNHDLSLIAQDSTTQQLLFEAAAAYVNVLRHARRHQIAQENVAVVQRGLHLQSERVARGSGISVDTLAAKARLQVARERAVVFESELQKAKTRYVQVFSKIPNPGTMTVPAIPNELVPVNLDDALAASVTQAPLMQDRAKAIELAQTDLDIAKGDYWPRLDLVGRARYENDYDGSEGYEKNASIRLRVTWDFFSGFATDAARKEAIHRLAASEKDRDYVRAQVEEDVSLAWTDLETARERAELFQNAVNIAGEIAHARRKLVSGGKESAVSLIDAQTEVFRARIEAIDAEFDTYVAVYRLLQAMGTLSPNMVR
ncbi:MAG: TolC family outer membrane protein [Magnetospiraceae bacterium]